MKSKDLPVIEDPKPLQIISLENSTKYDAHRKSPQKILNARTRTQRLQKHTNSSLLIHTQRQPTHTLPTTHTTKNIRNKRNTPHTHDTNNTHHTTPNTHTTQHTPQHTSYPHNTARTPLEDSRGIINSFITILINLFLKSTAIIFILYLNYLI